MKKIELNKRQETILQIVKDNGPITGEHIAEKLNLTRATLRPDLAILTMAGYLDARPRVGYFYTGKSSAQLLTESLKNIFVKDYQSMPVVVNENISVYDAIVTVFLEDGTLFVVDENLLLVGVLSRKDLLRASIGKQELSSLPVNIIMTRMPNITMCKKDDLLIDVAKKLIEKQIDSIPVVKETTTNGYEVIGRITKTNITKAFVALADEDL
ncbi:helix-turn-helix transcriptional regulator [Bacillus sporothermodurans]|nr:helix-turn-helix transcriptional regulator [Heyndrickxia sporothermodurans]MBL5811862.1 helix-turn-helix transcriptional regulator [Heyndrickxia sporothermodurans]MBL5815361.1 helix-turn-helix transcriptional regulator [Heyndrickxia sporothermodurans]MBL5818769.1 helix-turn-helix transcriptional regulator [Heyndrickxia sporothermodurans]MBL5843918.1 helix-turn-helix transcriptional regulator [Heyndrickxia sporothermodurans]